MVHDVADFADALRAHLAGMPERDEPSLPTFLRALLGRCWHARDEAPTQTPPWESLLEWIVAAMHGTAVDLPTEWLEDPRVPNELPAADADFDQLEQVLIFQIADLHQLKLVGKLRDEWSLLGLPSPSGAAWNSFAFFLYLENGIEGLLQHAPEVQAGWGALALLLEYARLPVDAL